MAAPFGRPMRRWGPQRRPRSGCSQAFGRRLGRRKMRERKARKRKALVWKALVSEPRKRRPRRRRSLQSGAPWRMMLRGGGARCLGGRGWRCRRRLASRSWREQACSMSRVLKVHLWVQARARPIFLLAMRRGEWKVRHRASLPRWKPPTARMRPARMAARPRLVAMARATPTLASPIS